MTLLRIDSLTYHAIRTDTDLKSSANLSETLKDPNYSNEDIGEKSALSVGLYPFPECRMR